MLEKEKDFIIYRQERMHAAFPSVVRLANNELLVGFRRARDHRWIMGVADGDEDPDLMRIDHVDPRSHIAIQRLGPDLQPIGPTRSLPSDPEAGDQDANLFRLQSGRILQYGFMWYPVTPGYAEIIKSAGGSYFGSPERTGMVYLWWGCYVRHSDDEGKHWSARSLLPPVEGLRGPVPGLRPVYGGSIRGRAVEIAEGHILVATYHGHPNVNHRNISRLYASVDGGLNWQAKGMITDQLPDPIGICEPSLAQTSDGGLLAFHRTFDNNDCLVTFRSDDGGEVWSDLTSHTLQGHPYDALVLPDGRIFLAYGYRHQPAGIRARLIDPEMSDFGTAHEFVIRDDGPSFDLGYPWAQLLPDGRILVVYYICDDQGVRHIAGSVIRYD
jgi:hypothetical protein